MTAEKAKLLRCKHCLKEFKYESEKRRHEQSHLPQFQCKVCSKNFSFISALRRHEKQHERLSTVTCTECGREFRDETLLKRHMKYAHAGSHTCSKCDTVFYSEAALRTHMKTHKAVSERRYQCSYEGCTKKFNFPHHLKHHELTHTDSKQHYCKICGKGFIQAHHLKAHLRTHSPDSNYNCTFPNCNKQFGTAFARKRHEKKYHIKTDSGISSDSNSAYDTSASNVYLQDTVLEENNMSPRAELTTEIGHDIHSPIIPSSEDFVEPIAEDLSIPKDYNHKAVNTSTNEVGDCHLVLGRCIMNDEGEKCVCLQINNTDYDFTPIETESVYNNNNNVSSNKANDCNVRECCGGSCGVRKGFISKDDAPEMAYKTDGTVKIKEFLDFVPRTGMEEKYDRDNDAKFIPMNSCKALLGNCIVSGNGTISDECLCAKMIIDDEVNAQEIDDITPQPRGALPLVI